MLELLAQDVKIPTPPTTSDPVTWIALCLVVVLVSALFVMLKDNRDALKVFREELAAERAVDEKRTEGLHDRLNCISDDTTAIRTKLGLGGS